MITNFTPDLDYTKYENMSDFFDIKLDMSLEDIFYDEQEWLDANIQDADDLYEAIQDCNGFDVDIIYYSEAMDYLRRNDTSLTKSLEIAAEYGYETHDLNSELLASLLATEEKRTAFWENTAEINEILNL